MAKKRKDAMHSEPASAAEQPAAPKPVSDLSAEELETRLESLRPRHAEAHATAAVASYLTFWIAGEQYALPLERAREIVRCEAFTKVPDTPAWLRGVTNIRGTVVPVVDLAPRLGCAETPIARRAAILLIEVDWTGECMVLGLLIEAVGRVATIAPDQLEPAPPFGTRIDARLVAGLVPVDAKFALALDIDAVLAAKELLPSAAVSDGAASAASGA